MCPADEEPPGEEPPGEEPPPDEVGGISEEKGPAVSADVALPNTGAPSDLQFLAMLGGLCSLAGVWLVASDVRRRRQPI